MASDNAPEKILASAETKAARPVVDPAHDLFRPFAAGERSCCCPSLPAVRLVLPASSLRDHPVDLLLCGHHFRRSHDTIARMGAWLSDSTGALVSCGGRVPVTAS